MAKTKTPRTLCSLCLVARDDPIFRYPTHLVHPITGDRMLFDVRGEGACAICRARWRRVLNVVTLVDDEHSDGQPGK
jgi:hypothetical protein